MANRPKEYASAARSMDRWIEIFNWRLGPNLVIGVLPNGKQSVGSARRVAD
jgi:hypothetical protein